MENNVNLREVLKTQIVYDPIHIEFPHAGTVPARVKLVDLKSTVKWFKNKFKK